MRSLILISCILLLPSCITRSNPLYCAAIGDCEIDGQVCDLRGVFEGIENQCIDDPYGQACPAGHEDCTLENRPYCDEGIERCRQCFGTDSCPNGGVCTNGRCIEQMCTQECGLMDPFCDNMTGECGPCTLAANGDSLCVNRFEDQPFCLEATGVCVTCRENAHCTERPEGDVCDELTNECVPCSDHDQCATGACIQGECLTTEEILYVSNADENVDNDTCDESAPCEHIAHALTLISDEPPRYTVLVENTGDRYFESLSISNIAQVNLISTGAIIDTDAQTPAIDLLGETHLFIDNFVVQGTEADLADGIKCHSPEATLHAKRLTVQDNVGQGIDVRDCPLTLERSYITSNGDGGVRVENTDFTITNNVIVGNGQGSSQAGGVFLARFSAGSPQILEFNTITRNNGMVAELFCNVPGEVNSSANIVYNGMGMTPTNFIMWEMDHSIVEGGAPGQDNIDMAPMFAGGENYALAEGSVGIDVSGIQPTSCSGDCVDHLGVHRPVGGDYDIGAYEYNP